MLADLETQTQQAAHNDILIGANGTGVVCDNAGRTGLFNRIPGEKLVTIRSVENNAKPASADVRIQACAYVGAPVYRNVGIALDQSGRGVDKASGNVLQLGLGKILSQFDPRSGIERLSQSRGDIARAIVKSGPVAPATIMCISKLSGRFAVHSDTHSKLEIAVIRDCGGGQIDQTSTEFAGIVDGIAFLHGCASEHRRGKNIEGNDALERFGRRKGGAIEQSLRITVAKAAHIDKTAIIHGQTGYTLKGTGDVAVTRSGNIFRRENGDHTRRIADGIGNIASTNDDLAAEIAAGGRDVNVVFRRRWFGRISVSGRRWFGRNGLRKCWKRAECGGKEQKAGERGGSGH